MSMDTQIRRLERIAAESGLEIDRLRYREKAFIAGILPCECSNVGCEPCARKLQISSSCLMSLRTGPRKRQGYALCHLKALTKNVPSSNLRPLPTEHRLYLCMECAITYELARSWLIERVLS